MKQVTGIPAEIRRKELLEILNAKGHVTVNALCEHFGVSPATIRNDMNELEALQCLKRTHGGALALNSMMELTSFEKLELHASEKQAIAHAALPLAQSGQVIAIDTGTTTFEFARLVAGIPRLTVITNDLKIANYLEENSDANVILLGGVVRKNFHCTVGRSALDQMASLHADVAFMATNTMDADWGLSTPSIETADVKRCMLRNAHMRVLLADSSKIGGKSLARFATMDEVDMLICDAGADAAFVRKVESMDVRVLLA